MPLSKGDIVLIEKYLDNDLSSEENDLFNVRMEDEAFTEELKLQQSTADALKQLFEQQLKEELRQQLHAHKPDESESKRTIIGFNKRYFYWAAAAIAFVILAIITVRQRSSNAESLYLAYYKPYPAVTITRSVPGDGNHLAFEKYNEQNYGQAATLLEQLLKDSTQAYNTAFLQLLLGNCYLNTGDLEKAVTSFKNVASSTDPLLSQHAKWYSALTLLKIGDHSEALRLLHELTSSDSMYKGQAGSLMDELQDRK